MAYEVTDGTAYVTLNRPDFRNAQNSVMTYSLDNAFIKAVEDDSVKVIVLRAAGKHFSAGHDIGTPERDHHVQYPNRAALWWDHTTRGGGDRRRVGGPALARAARVARAAEAGRGTDRREC